VELERLLQFAGVNLIAPKRKPSETGTAGLLGGGGPFVRTGLLGAPRSSRPAALNKLHELQRSIDGFECNKEVGPACNEFICEGLIGKVGAGKRPTERYAFLFDGLLLLCKASGHGRRSSAASPGCEYRLKEKFFIRKVEILDRRDEPDSDLPRNAFEVAPRQQPHCILFCRTAEEKMNWMAALVMLNTKSMLERTLDVILLDEELKHPLRLPPPTIYRFAEEDAESFNIVLETRENGGVPLIKGQSFSIFP